MAIEFDEAVILEQMRKKTAWFQENASTLTMKSVRRMVESELGMVAGALDPHKARLSDLIDEVSLSCMACPRSSDPYHVL